MPVPGRSRCTPEHLRLSLQDLQVAVGVEGVVVEEHQPPHRAAPRQRDHLGDAGVAPAFVIDVFRLAVVGGVHEDVRLRGQAEA